MSPADLVIRTGRAHTMAPAYPGVTSLAVRDGRIAALARHPEDLSGWIGPGTTMIEDPRLVVLPAFTDTHNHLMLVA
jgi:predicted amidohydrolase YtcJ